MSEWRREGALAWLTFPSLTREGAVAVFSGRQGGVSPFPYASLNLAPHTGDSWERVRKNRLSLLAALDLEGHLLFSPQQVHGDVVAEVPAGGKAEGVGEIQVVPGCDALITSRPGVLLLAFFADCVPLYIVDPVNRAVGLAHAGWRGTVREVGKKTLAAMRRAYGTEPAACQVVVGPSIGACCYKVGEEVVKGLASVQPDPEGVTRGRDGIHLDLKAANARMLLEAGVSPSRLSVSGYCTSCRPDLFFSYRRDGTTGRMAALIGFPERKDKRW